MQMICNWGDANSWRNQTGTEPLPPDAVLQRGSQKDRIICTQNHGRYDPAFSYMILSILLRFYYSTFCSNSVILNDCNSAADKSANDFHG
jgi:hypothetical protein